jgi:hypothetical protein
LQDDTNMAGIDLPALAAAGAVDAQRPARQKPIPKAIRLACDALVNGYAKTLTEAAERVGITREYLSRRLGEPHIVEHLRQRAHRVVSIAAGRAAATKVELLDCDSLHVRSDASTFVLGVAGIKPTPDPNISLNIGSARAGYVIILGEERVTPPLEPKQVEGKICNDSFDVTPKG